MSKEYSDAIGKAGGVPVVLPVVEDPEILSAMLQRVDAVILATSAKDLDPRKRRIHAAQECATYASVIDERLFETFSLTYVRAFMVELKYHIKS